MQRKTISVCATVAAALVPSSFAFGLDYYWLGGTDTLTSSNYTDGTTAGVAIPNAAGHFANLGENGTVTHSATGTDFGRLRIGHMFTGGVATGGDVGPATLNMSGGTLFLGGNNTTGASGDGAGLAIGYNTNGTLNLSGGQIDVTRFVNVGHDNTTDSITGTGTGTLNLSGTGILRASLNDMLVGNGVGNAGVVTVADSAVLTVAPFSLTNTSNPDIIVGSVTASTWTQTGGTVNAANNFSVRNGSTVTLSGGSINSLFRNPANGYNGTAPNGNVNIGNSGAGATFILNSGGTLNAGNNVTIGVGGSVGAVFTMNGGTINTETGGGTTGNIFVGTGTSSGATFNVQGGTINNQHRFLMGGGTSTGNVTNHSAGDMTIALNFVIGDVGGDSTYNFSGGTITANAEVSRVGRRGLGTMNHTGGVANFNAALAIGDWEAGTVPTTGVYEISGGELHATITTGNALRVGTAGTGTLRVVGDDGLIDVNGGFLVDKTANGLGTLAFELEAGDPGLSQIDVSGAATFSLDSALSLDFAGNTPAAPSFNLLTATTITDNGLDFTGPAGWSFQIVSGGNGQILQAFTAPAGANQYWDIDGVNPGAGGASPSGNWDGVATNFNSDAGGGAGTLTAVTTSADTVVFSAGTDGTGAYTVTVGGTQNAAAVQVDRGTVSFTGGTLATGVFNVAAGASASVDSAVSSTTGLTKTGDGTLAVTSTPTHTGGTDVVAGTLQLKRMHEGNAVTIASGAKLQILDSSPTLPDHPSGDNALVSRPSSLTIAAGGQLDLGNNDLIIDYDGATSPVADIEALVASGFNGGEWNGDGIISTTALNDPNFVLAVAENALLLQPFGDGVGDDPLFAGQVVDDTTVLVKFTHRVDLDLDGLITGNDAAVFNAFYNEGQPATWQFGDLDYDGVYSGNDAAIFNGFYNESLASVPEPAGLALAACGLALLARRRRGARRA